MNVKGRVTHSKGAYPVAGVRVVLQSDTGAEIAAGHSGDDGHYSIGNVPEGTCKLTCKAFGQPYEAEVRVEAGRDTEHDVPLDLGLCITLEVECDCTFQPSPVAVAGRRTALKVDAHHPQTIGSTVWRVYPAIPGVPSAANQYEVVVPHGVEELRAEASLTETPSEGRARTYIDKTFRAAPAEVSKVTGDVRVHEPVSVRLQRTASDPTLDQALWVSIRNRTRALSFERYQHFMNAALQWEERPLEVGWLDKKVAEEFDRDINELGTHLHGIHAYQTLKHLTELFVLLECGVRIGRNGGRHRVPFDAYSEARRLGRPFSIEEIERNLREYLGDRAQLPYITRVVRASFPELLHGGLEDHLIAARINEPCLIELIWSYWMEEGMLVQTINATCRRFQNVHDAGPRDPLANLEIDPLRPLNNLLWGYIQDEYNRLSVRRQRLRIRPSLWPHALWQSGFPPAPGRNPVEVSGSLPQPPLPELGLLQGGFPDHRHRRRLSAAELAAGSPPHPRSGRPEPVRRPALDRARGNDAHAVPALAPRDPRLPAGPRHGPVPRAVGGPGGRHEEPAGLDRRHRLSFPRPCGLRRAVAPVHPLRRLDRGQRRILGHQLGALFPAGTAGVPARLPGGDRHRSDQSGYRGCDDSRCPLAEAGSHAAGAVDAREMLDFTSALYLGFEHPSWTLPPWRRLTLGKPAALEELWEALPAQQELETLTGCERVQLGASTLHLFCDLFAMLAGPGVAVWIDGAAYPIARWGADRAAAMGTPVRIFPRHDADALRRAVRAWRPIRPVIVTDGYCPLQGRHAPLGEYAGCAAEANGLLVVDDTQALGVFGCRAEGWEPYGAGGGGSLRYCGVCDPRIVVVSSLAKAFGVPVAMIGGAEAMMTTFQRNSPSLVHASPPSAAAIAAARRALRLNRRYGDLLRRRLARRVRRFRRRAAGLLGASSWFPVQPVQLPAGADAGAVFRALEARGVRPLLVRDGRWQPRLVFVLSARHRRDEIDYAAESLRDAVSAAIGKKGRSRDDVGELLAWF